MPNGVDIIVRGVKAGLPLGDCIKVVAREAREPVATEFRKIQETQVMGISLAEAVAKLPERTMPCCPKPISLPSLWPFSRKPVAVWQKPSANLSKVLRGRKALKGKIKALSSEAKSSAMIIGALPLLVGGIMFLIAPDYIMLLFDHHYWQSDHWQAVCCGCSWASW